jgi:hypothetical protein
MTRHVFRGRKVEGFIPGRPSPRAASSGVTYLVAVNDACADCTPDLVPRRVDCACYEQCLYAFKGAKDACCPKACEHYVQLKLRAVDFADSPRNIWDRF